MNPIRCAFGTSKNIDVKIIDEFPSMDSDSLCSNPGMPKILRCSFQKLSTLKYQTNFFIQEKPKFMVIWCNFDRETFKKRISIYLVRYLGSSVKIKILTPFRKLFFFNFIFFQCSIGFLIRIKKQKKRVG